MSSDTPMGLRWATPEDHPALLALFERAFGGCIERDLWAWKYPAGTQQSLLAEKDGLVVAHYGGLPRRMMGRGKPLNCLQISDIMVDPKARGVLTRNGVFAQISNEFTNTLTAPAGQHDFVYGFPSPRASKLGEMLGMYAPLDTLLQLSWPSRPSRPSGPAWRRSKPLPLSALAKAGDALWDRQKELGESFLITVRDKAWLEQRYVQHPGHEYRALAQQPFWQRTPSAALIYRAHAHALEIIDMVGQPSAYQRLVQDLCYHAAQMDKASVFAWVTTATEPWLPSAQERETLLPVNIAGTNKAHWQACFQGRSWLTAGDTDYR